VHYFTDGAVIGSKAFVNQVFERLKSAGAASKKRTSGARQLREIDAQGLYSLRDLRKEVLGG